MTVHSSKLYRGRREHANIFLYKVIPVIKKLQLLQLFFLCCEFKEFWLLLLKQTRGGIISRHAKVAIKRNSLIFIKREHMPYLAMHRSRLVPVT